MAKFIVENNGKAKVKVEIVGNGVDIIPLILAGVSSMADESGTTAVKILEIMLDIAKKGEEYEKRNRVA